MTNLLSKKSKFIWSDKCQQVFNKLKAILGNTLVLLAPDFNKCFKLAVDASDIGVGAVLLQEDDNRIDFPVLSCRNQLMRFSDIIEDFFISLLNL